MIRFILILTILGYNTACTTAQNTIQREIIYDVYHHEYNDLNLDAVGGYNMLISKVLQGVVDGDIEAYMIPKSLSDTINQFLIPSNYLNEENIEIIDPELLGHFFNDLNYYESYKYGKQTLIGVHKYNSIKNMKTPKYIEEFEKVFYCQPIIDSSIKTNNNGFIVYDENGKEQYYYDTLFGGRKKISKTSIGFHEEWILDSKNESFRKVVKGILLKCINEQNEDIDPNNYTFRPDPYCLYIPINFKKVDKQKYKIPEVKYVKVGVIGDQNYRNIPDSNYESKGIFNFLDTTFRYELYKSYFGKDSLCVNNEFPDFFEDRIGWGCRDNFSKIVLHQETDKEGNIVYNDFGGINTVSKVVDVGLQYGRTVEFIEEWYIRWDEFSFGKKVKGFVSGECYYPIE